MPSVEAIATDVGIAPEESARAGFHALLARLFVTPPVTELLCQIAARGPIGSAGGAGDLPAAWDPLRLAVAACSPEAVHQKFDDLFVAVAEPRVALDGSCYLTGTLMETPLAVLHDDLAGLGQVRLRGVLETEVHVAAPAEVMRLLILDTRRPQGARLEIQRGFLRKHIAPWYRDYYAAVGQATVGETFYRRAVEFARQSLVVEPDSFQIG